MDHLSRRKVGYWVLWTSAFSLSLAGCGDDDDGGTAPGVPHAVLGNAWPHEDGRRWAYLVTVRMWGDSLIDSAFVYEDPELVPPAPDITEILPLIDHPVLPDSFDVAVGEWQLVFSGAITTSAGVTAQNLVEVFPSGPRGAYASRSPASSRFLNLLAVVRPDVGSRLGVRGVLPSRSLGPRFLAGADTLFEEIPLGPLFLHGGAWEQTGDHIGTYVDEDSLLSWKFLDDEIRAGHRFSHPVLSSLVDDVVLHALVRDAGTLQTPVGTLANVVQVAYLLDYGKLSVTEVGSTDPFAEFRAIAYGMVLYAPTVGPVGSYERNLVLVGETLSEGLYEVEVNLLGVQAGRGD